MNWIKNLKINKKLIVMILIPMLGLLYFSITAISEKLNNLNAMNELQLVTKFAVDVNEVIHELQKERGIVSGYYGKKTIKIQNEMIEQRKETTRKILLLKTSLKTIETINFGENFSQNLSASMKELDMLEQYRKSIDDNTTDGNEIIAYYKETFYSFFNLMENLKKLSTHSEVTNQLSAYINFSRSKAAVSLERALLNNIFAQNQIDAGDIQKINLLINEQANYFQVYASFATPQALEFYKTTVSGQAINEVNRMKKLAMEAQIGKPLDVNADDWYQRSTQKIDLYKQVEIQYSNDLLTKLEEIKTAAIRSLFFVITINLLVLILSLVVIFIISRMLLRQISVLKQSTELILQGETEVMVEVVTRDEFGELTVAFNQMVASLRDVIAQADRISQGEYELTITPRSNRDRLSIALIQMLTSLKETTAENERQNWLKTQLSRLTSMSQGETNLQKLVTMLISEISRLIEAGQGVFYVKDVEKRGEFILLGSYAYKERKNLSNRFRMGEGLVGQCALEKKSILLTQVPDDYVQISSGLGESKPMTLLVLPILFEDEVVAVIEVATFRTFTDTQHDFLTQLSTTLGVVINSTTSRQRTEELLTESQVLTEELQTQQEELRTSNEELQEQTHMLKRSEEKLKIQSEELQAINEEMEEKTNHLELQKADIEKQNRLIRLSKNELEVKASELELASKYKSEFLANMSHELRTPLNSLLILAKMLAKNEEQNLTEDQIESAQIIYSGGLDLLTLINDILDLSKVEAGKLDIHIEEVKLASIARNLEYQFNSVAQEKGIKFELTIDEGIPESLLTDGLRTEQILKNFLSNAFKFTSEGLITLRFYLPGSEIQFTGGSGLSASNTIAMMVKDTGIGIPEHKQKAIFEAFQQADGSTSRKYGGTGLGLTISRELAKLLGGVIHLSSRQNEGSTFTLFLPINGQETSPMIANHTTSFREVAMAREVITEVMENVSESTLEFEQVEQVETVNELFLIKTFIADDRQELTSQSKVKVILIVEDDKHFAKVLLDLSRKKGFKCIVAGDGFSGLQLAKQYIPSAVLLDLGLPDMNGLKLLDHLKYTSETRHIPVHIISGKDESKASLKKGAVGFLSKPISSDDIEMMFTRIENVLNERIKLVLVVEDDMNNQKAICELLKHKKIDIRSVNTGKEGLELLKAQVFDCVILDLKLPDMTGFEMLQQLRGYEKSKVPPIIINTGKDLTQEEYKELNLFTDSIVIKGVNSPERLLDEVSLFLHSVQKSLPPEQRQMIRMLHDSDETLKGRKVLLVDDDLRNTFALSKVLKQHGMNVVMADNGKLALEKLDSEEGIELVIMDIMMPIMDGYEAMKRIRDNPKFQSLPIIALTAKAMTGDREKCIEGGANDYMTKPVDSDKLLSLIRVWLFK